MSASLAGVVFRDGVASQDESFDPLARLFDLQAALVLTEVRAFGGNAHRHLETRLLAARLASDPTPVTELVTAVQTATDTLASCLGGGVEPPLVTLLAAVLVTRGDDPVAFVAEVDRVRWRMRELGVRRHAAYQILAIAALRLRNAGAPIPDEQIRRTQAIYEAIKSHHWFLTGPEDLPLCALLATTEAEPEALADRAAAIAQALRTRAGLWRGETLQTISLALALGSLGPEELADRFLLLAQTFEAAGVDVGIGRYDELALLCFLPRPAERIVDGVVRSTAAIREREPALRRSLAFSLACSLEYAHRSGDTGLLAGLADTKVLLDMQLVISGRQPLGDGSVGRR